MREKYESYHKCKYTLEALNAAVQLSARYIPDRHLPDKAIDLIDEVESKAHMESFNRKKGTANLYSFKVTGRLLAGYYSCSGHV